MTITSTRSPRVQAVRRLTRRSARVAERRFVVEGPQAVREALAAGALLELYAEPGRQPELEAAALAAGVEVVPVAVPVLAAMAETVTPQGVLGTAVAARRRPAAALAGSPRLVAVLEAVSDPGNAGTSSARPTPPEPTPWCSPTGRSTPTTASASGPPPAASGTCRSSPARRWSTPWRRCGRAGLQVLATTGAGDHDLDDLLDDGSLTAPTAWLLGSEAAGRPRRRSRSPTAPSGCRCTAGPSR
jgi:TrmH family RNA methyltransferase